MEEGKGTETVREKVSQSVNAIQESKEEVFLRESKSFKKALFSHMLMDAHALSGDWSELNASAVSREPESTCVSEPCKVKHICPGLLCVMHVHTADPAHESEAAWGGKKLILI